MFQERWKQASAVLGIRVSEGLFVKLSRNARARDLADAAKKIESVQLSYSLVKNGQAEQVDENAQAVQNEIIQ
jgi:hypothetical protein